MTFYKGYILIRLKLIGFIDVILDKLKSLKPCNNSENWLINYASQIHGGWDLIVECCFKNLEDLHGLVEHIRSDNGISNLVETTTTLIGIKPDFAPNSN